jgi:hypothetical protein
MDAETVVKFPEPKPRLHCTICHAEGPAPCGHSASHYITAAQAKERRKEFAHDLYRQGLTQEQIAERLHVSQDTIKRDLADFDLTKIVNSPRPKTARNPKGAGRRKGTKGKRKKQASPKHDKARDVVRPLVEAGEAINRDKLAAEHGLTHGAIQRAEIAERARLEAMADPIIDPSTLSMTAQQKIAAAQRQMRRHLEAEHAARLHGLAEEVRQQVLTRNKEYLATLNKMEEEAASTKRLYREFMDQQAKIFSKDEYRLIVMCVHADASISDEKRNEATRMLIAKRFALTGEK